MQAGDITKGDGTGGTSIYAGTPLGDLWGHFRDEKFLPHDRAGLLSMANSKPNSNRYMFTWIYYKIDDRYFGRQLSVFCDFEFGTSLGR